MSRTPILARCLAVLLLSILVARLPAVDAPYEEKGETESTYPVKQQPNASPDPGEPAYPTEKLRPPPPKPTEKRQEPAPIKPPNSDVQAWDTLSGPVFPALRHLARDNSGVLYLAGQGVIAALGPNDTVLRVEHFHPGESYHHIAFAGSFPVALGEGGRVRRRTPLGTWVLLPMEDRAENLTLRDLVVIGAERWFVGDSGLIVREVEGRLQTWRRPTDRNLRAVAPDGEGGLWIAGEGILLHIFRGVDYERKSGTWGWDTVSRAESLYDIHFPEPGRGIAVGAEGAILKKAPGEEIWRRAETGMQDTLFSISFADGREGRIVGSGGVILRTADGGETWHRATRTLGSGSGKAVWAEAPYYTLPAPWWFLSGFFIVALLMPLLRRPQAEAVEAVSTHLMADRPLEHGDPDPMNFESLALGVSLFLRNRETEPPLTLAVAGEWGKGKSSLMNLLRSDLRRNRFPTVWFNAWHHQTQEHILAALLSNIRAQAVPGWLSLQGLLFRARLLGLRIQRMRGTVSVVLILASLLVGFLVGYPRRTDEALQNLSELTGMLLALDFGRMIEAWRTLPNAPVGALLALLFLGGLLLWRLLPVFGVKPATLMAHLKGNLPMRELNRLAGFRFQFAVEFREFTRALGRHNLVILIDDLDRCNPEFVLDVMESVNFLTSCGNCVVVMGMDMEFVQSCIGLGFEEVAEEQYQLRRLKEQQLLKDADRKTTPPDWEAAIVPNRELAGPVLETSFEQRNHFATKYLEKLINIRVPLPTPSRDQFFRIILPEEIERARLRKRAARLEKALPRGLRFVALVAFVWLLGGWASKYGPDLVDALLAERHVPDSALVSAEPGAPGSDAGSEPGPTAGAGETRTRATGSPQAQPQPIATATAAQEAWHREPPRLQMPRPAGRWDWTPYALLAIVAALCLTGAALKPHEVVRDSRQFRRALELWSPLIYLSNRTPRSIKRFLNRVRYLAMQQRAHVQPEGPVYRIVAWLDRLLGTKAKVDSPLMRNAVKPPLGPQPFSGPQQTSGPEQSRDSEEQTSGSESPIPENVLVGLTALEHLAPRALESLGRKADATVEDLVGIVQGRLSQDGLARLEKEMRASEFHRYLPRFRSLAHEGI